MSAGRTLRFPPAHPPSLCLLRSPHLQTIHQHLLSPLIDVLVSLHDAHALKRVPGRGVFGFREDFTCTLHYSIPFAFGPQNMQHSLILHDSCCMYLPRLLGNVINFVPPETGRKGAEGFAVRPNRVIAVTDAAAPPPPRAATSPNHSSWHSSSHRTRKSLHVI